MTDRKPAAKDRRGSGGLGTEEERAAVKEWVRETRARRRGPTENGDQEVLAKIAEMQPPDRGMAERLHALIKTHAPTLTSRTWYGMPAYCKDGEVLCFFQTSQKFKTRYSTIGFSDEAKLDEGHMWPVAFALSAFSAADEARFVALLKKAVG